MSGGFAPDPDRPAQPYRREVVMGLAVEAPDRTPADPPKVPRASGGECDVMATLGVRRRSGPVAPDDMVHDWTEVRW